MPQSAAHRGVPAASRQAQQVREPPAAVLSALASPCRTAAFAYSDALFLLVYVQVCPLCAAFTTHDAEALQRHVELCAARRAGGGDGAGEGAARDEEAAYQRFLALRGLPMVQTSLLLLVLNSLGTAVRLGLPLLDARFARVRSRGLAALPVLHSLDGHPPLLPSDLPDDVLWRFAALLFPAIAAVRLPTHVAAFYVTTSPAWRPWYTQHHEWLWPAILLVEILVAGTYLEAVIWVLLRRVVVWPAAMMLTNLVGDLISHRIWVRAGRAGVGGCAARAPRRCLAIVPTSKPDPSPSCRPTTPEPATCPIPPHLHAARRIPQHRLVHAAVGHPVLEAPVALPSAAGLPPAHDSQRPAFGQADEAGVPEEAAAQE
jgi:hypothetical protein